MGIKQIIPVQGKWHVATFKKGNETAVLQRIACWALTDEDDEVVPMIADLRNSDDSLVSVRDVVNVIGLVPPGEERNGVWNSIAAELLENEREDEERKVMHDTARVVFDKIGLPQGAMELLERFRLKGMVPPPGEACDFLVDYKLIEPAESSFKVPGDVEWIPTKFGGVFLEFFKSRHPSSVNKPATTESNV